jgi:hypothetical protein
MAADYPQATPSRASHIGFVDIACGYEPGDCLTFQQLMGRNG